MTTPLATTVGYKLNSRYDVTPWLALRGRSDGFPRALAYPTRLRPDGQSHRRPTQYRYIVPTYTKLANNTSALARALGAQDLKPENQPITGSVLCCGRTSRLNSRSMAIRFGSRTGSSGPHVVWPAFVWHLAANNLPATLGWSISLMA